MTRNALILLFWQLLRTVTQAVWVIGLGRLLGVANYGTFAGLAGLATALGALSGLGFGLLMLEQCSRNPSRLGAYWPRTLIVLLLSALILCSAYIFIAISWLDNSIAMVMLLNIALPELLFAPLTIQASYAFQTHERMAWAGAMYSLTPLGNIAALACSLLQWPQVTLASYLHWHIWGSLFAAGLALLAVTMKLQPTLRFPHITFSELREAFGFVIMRWSDAALGSLDKTLVFRLAGAEVAGYYTAAYRLIGLIALPAVSLAISITPRLFRQATTADTKKSAQKRLLIIGCILGALGIPLAWGLSFSLPWLFGEEFRQAAELVRLGSLIPALLGLSVLGGTVLMTLGRKGLRTLLQLLALFIITILMYLLTPLYGEAGVMLALLLTYLFLVVAVWKNAWQPKKT